MKIFPISVPIEVMALLYNNNGVCISNLAKKLDNTFSHVYHVCVFLESKEFIISKKKGRQKIIRLTKKGILLSKICLELKEVISK